MTERMSVFQRISLCCVIAVLLCACGVGTGGVTMTKSQENVTQTEQPTTTPHRPFRVVQICLDTPPLYPVALFTHAANTVADWIEADVTSNQDGFVVYTDEISSQSFQSNVIAPIQVPAMPADPGEPTPIPTYTPTPGENPYHAADVQATRDASNDQMYTSWQTQVARTKALVAATLTKVKATTHRLRTRVPVFDAQAADVLGCLADASAHFQGVSGETDLIIASAWINNTAINEVAGLNLHHAHVRGIFRPCPSARRCTEQDRFWTHTLSQVGAQDVAFYDAPQSVLLPPQF